MSEANSLPFKVFRGQYPSEYEVTVIEHSAYEQACKERDALLPYQAMYDTAQARCKELEARVKGLKYELEVAHE